MSIPRPPLPVNLVISLLFKEEEEMASVLAETERQYGPIDFLSEPLSFDFTAYYEPEMGRGLRRRVASFGTFIDPEDLVPIKLWTNGLEARYLKEDQGRKVNIDPGYLAASRFILATGKDYSHRIYLGKGIYGDLTLIFQKGSLAPLPWTYPDYASQPVIGLLNLLRKRYLWQLKNTGFQGSRGQDFKDGKTEIA